MNIGIVGGGSIGLLTAVYLSKKHRVTLYVRRMEQKEMIEAKGLVLKDISGQRHYIPVEVRTLDMLKQEDCLLICVKQTHVRQVLHDIVGQDRDTPLIFLQNGISHIEAVKQLDNPVYIGITEHGAIRLNDYEVHHTGIGKIKLGKLKGNLDQFKMIAESFSTDSFPVEMISDWQSILKEKLIVNAVINPLTALFDIPNGALIELPELHAMAKTLCREVTDSLQEEFERHWEHVQTVAGQTRLNTSSMLQDIKNHKKTEIDAILGPLAANRKNSLIGFLYQSVKALEEKGRKGYS